MKSYAEKAKEKKTTVRQVKRSQGRRLVTTPYSEEVAELQRKVDNSEMVKRQMEWQRSIDESPFMRRKVREMDERQRMIDESPLMQRKAAERAELQAKADADIDRKQQKDKQSNDQEEKDPTEKQTQPEKAATENEMAAEIAAYVEKKLAALKKGSARATQYVAEISPQKKSYLYDFLSNSNKLSYYAEQGMEHMYQRMLAEIPRGVPVIDGVVITQMSQEELVAFFQEKYTGGKPVHNVKELFQNNEFQQFLKNEFLKGAWKPVGKELWKNDGKAMLTHTRNPYDLGIGGTLFLVEEAVRAVITKKLTLPGVGPGIPIPGRDKAHAKGYVGIRDNEKDRYGVTIKDKKSATELKYEYEKKKRIDKEKPAGEKGNVKSQRHKFELQQNIESGKANIGIKVEYNQTNFDNNKKDKKIQGKVKVSYKDIEASINTSYNQTYKNDFSDQQKYFEWGGSVYYHLDDQGNIKTRVKVEYQNIMNEQTGKKNNQINLGAEIHFD